MASQRPPRELTDDELLAFAGIVARAYIEAERGHRHARRLFPLATHAVWYPLSIARPDMHAPRLTSRDLRPVQLNRISADRAYATVVFREDEQRWSALSIILRRSERGAWRAAHVVRPDVRHPQALERSSGDERGPDKLSSSR